MVLLNTIEEVTSGRKGAKGRNGDIILSTIKINIFKKKEMETQLCENTVKMGSGLAGACFLFRD